MIDVKSLRYNSIVRYEIDGNIEDFMVTAISEGGVTLKNDNHLVAFAKHEDIEPLPLSESLLIDSGFEVVNGINGLFELKIVNYNSIRLVKFSGHYEVRFISPSGEQTSLTYCQYLHQLQNIILDLSGKELPIKK